MELKSGNDYHDHFDTKSYLSSYLSGNPENRVWDIFATKCCHEFWSKLPRNNLRVLNFGGGPTISDLISAAPCVEEIVFAEYTEKNRQAVEKWQKNLPESPDWSPFFKFIVEKLEGNSSEEVTNRESELRKKIRHILPCDIEWEDPVKWPSTWGPQSATFDVVTTSFCLEVCAKSYEGYRQAIAKLKRYLKPNGHIVLFGSLGESYYIVGQERFRSFTLSKNFIVETLASEGFKMAEDMKVLDVNDEDESDAKEMFFLSAVLKD